MIAFADEEGARFNTPTLGSRALVSRLDASEVLARVDERGVTMREAMGAAGVDPDGLGEAPGWLGRLRGLLELHIDQSRDVAELAVAAGVVQRLAARMRVEVELGGSADHAGTTRRTERRDALLAAARLIVRADELAPPAMVVTAGRILVEPNAPTTVPSRVRLWLDARAPSPEELDSWWTGLEAASAELRSASGVELRAVVASINRGTVFDARVRGALREAGDREGLGGAPEIVCFAGHDAGVIAERRPEGMVLVRNVAGVSHAPAEDVDLEDAALAADPPSSLSPGGKPRKHPKAGRRPVALKDETHRAKQMERNTRRETGVPSAVSFSYSLRGALPLLDHSTTLVVAPTVSACVCTTSPDSSAVSNGRVFSCRSYA